MALRAPAQPDVHGRLLSDRPADAAPPEEAADRSAGLEDLAARLGHRFHRIALLREALTHPSLDPRQRGRAKHGYERLEFLGDRVLGLVIADWLLERFPKEGEGAIAMRHTAQVRRETLAEVARAVDFGPHLILSPGEAEQGGRDNPAILADACEAAIGALFRDGGLEAAAAFIRRAWAEFVERDRRPPQDPKSALQQWALGRGLPLPRYTVVAQEGPDHLPRFEIRVEVQGRPPASAIGASKRDAERAAASTLLATLPR